MKKLLSFISIFLCMILLCSCETWDNFKKAFLSPKTNENKIIKVGIIEPSTGRQSYDAEDEKKGFEFAREMFPSVYGYQIEFVYQDNRSDTDVAKEAAQKLIDAGCCIVLGSYSDTLSLAASDVFKEGKTPVIAASCTIPILTQTNPYYFRVSSINSFDAQSVAKYIYEKLEADKCAVLLPSNNDPAANKAELFENKFVSLCGSNVFTYTSETIDPKTNKTVVTQSEEPTVFHINIDGGESEEDIKNILKELDAKGYQNIYCPCDSNAVIPWIKIANDYIFIEEQKELDALKEKEEKEKEELKDKEKEDKKDDPEEKPEEKEDKYFFNFIGTDKWQGIENSFEFEDEDYSILNHIKYTKDYDADASINTMSIMVAEKFKNKYGDNAILNDNIALGFDAYYLAYNALLSNFTNALKELDITEEEFKNDDGLKQIVEELLFDNNGSWDKERITKELYKTRNLLCVTGTISIDSFGDPAKDTLIEGFVDGAFIVIDSIMPDSIAN